MSTATASYSTLTEALQSTYYGLAHLGLATAAYTYQGFPTQIAQQLANFIPTLPQLTTSAANPPYPTLPGYWNLDWGPALCTGNGGAYNDNLIAVVSYREGSATGTPYFFAVLCRGTDVSGGIAQISEDLDATTQQSWVDVLQGNYTYSNAKGGMTVVNQTKAPIPSTAAGNIATGTANALIAATNLVPYNPSPLGNSLIAAIVSLLSSNPGTPIVVTGHSLGGALTQVVSAYLSWQLDTQSTPVTVIPQAFAPPTVGDADFVAYYNHLFASGSQYWVNTADLVPCGFANLEDAKALWGAYNWPDTKPSWGPTIFGTGSDLASQTLKRVEQDKLVGYIEGMVPTYVRPANVVTLTASTTLPTETQMQAFLATMGQDPNSWNSFVSVLEFQHFPPQYYALMSSQVTGIMAYQEVAPPPSPLPGPAAS